MKIPFNKPFIVGKELYYIAKAVLEGHISGDGPYTKRCHRWLEDRLGSPQALLTHSCTAATAEKIEKSWLGHSPFIHVNTTTPDTTAQVI